MTKPKMIAINIIAALPDNPGTSFDFTADYTHTVGVQSVTEHYTIFNTAYFVQELLQHFDEHLIKLPETNPQTALVSLFNTWKASRADAYARRMYALSTKYEPLENYDRIEHKEGQTDLTHGEEIEREHNNTDTETHTADTVTRSYNNYNEETTRSGSETDAKGIYGVNSSSNNPVPSDTDTHTYNDVSDSKDISGSYSDAHTGSVSSAHTGTITDTHSGTDTTEDSYDLRAHGNIGVTTSAQMLTEDFKLLSLDIAQTAVAEFIDRYTYYVGGLDL